MRGKLNLFLQNRRSSVYYGDVVCDCDLSISSLTLLTLFEFLGNFSVCDNVTRRYGYIYFYINLYNCKGLCQTMYVFNVMLSMYTAAHCHGR